MHIKDPIEIINKFTEFKRYEVNLRSASSRKHLYLIQYDTKREKAIQFLDRFEEIVLNYENIPGSTPLYDDEKHDGLYNAIMSQVPEVQSVDFMTKIRQVQDSITTYLNCL